MNDPINIHFVPKVERQTIQNALLKRLLAYVQENAPFYKKHFETHAINIENIQSQKDLTIIPTTTKEDLQQCNWDFLCVPKREIAEYTATSGTLGKPVTIALTKNDLNRLAFNEANSFELLGLADDDIVQLMLTLDRQFMAGIAYYSGLQMHKGAVVRTGPGLPEMQLEVIQKLGTTVLVAVPSFLLKIIKVAKEKNIDLNNLPVKKVLAIGENVRQGSLQESTLLQRISEDWQIEIYGTYASTEMQAAFTECNAHQGGHLQPEMLIVEILDDQGNTVPDGEIGEVTVTTLGVEGMPLIRYRTGDLAQLYTEGCSCGRNTPRLGPIVGRKKQMIKYKGTSLYPPTIIETLNAIPAIQEYVVEVSHDELAHDQLLIHIHTPLEEIEANDLLKPILKANLRVLPKIRYCGLNEIQQMQFPPNSRKQIKFIDRRP